MFKNNQRITRSVLLGSAATLLAGSITGVGSLAYAQDQDDDAIEEIVVTGTRITRPDLASPSPITSIGKTDLVLSNTIHVESFLNTLPPTIPGIDGSSNNPGTGEASVNLRGLGSSRTLVLVNGRRYITSNQTFQTDLNTIPSALIERIDVVTGGASAVYGSDAVSGVINFILKTDFEGLQNDSSYEITEEGDGGIFDISFTVGGSFADGRGNAVLFAQYSRRESILQGDRDESFVTLNDAGPGNPLSETGSVNVLSGFVLDFAVDLTAAGVAPFDATAAPGEECAATEGTAPSGAGFCTTDTFGFLFNPGGTGVIPFINGGPNNNRFNYAPDNFLQLPAERYTMAAMSTYQINDNIEFYSRLIYTSSFVDQLLAPTPVFTTLTINEDNPFVGLAADPVTWAALLTTTYCGDGVTFSGLCGVPIDGGVAGDADNNGVTDVQVVIGRRMRELGGRLAAGKNDALQVAAGLRGDLGGGFDYDLFASFNRGDFAAFQTGNVSRSAYQAALREGRINIFDEGGITQDAADDIKRVGAIIGFNEQIVLSGSVSGEIAAIQTPWAELPLAIAAGVEYRDERLEAVPDSVLGPDVAGFNQAPEVRGDFDVYEFYMEAQLPLVQGAAFAEEISLNAAYRYSDYSTVGGTNTFAGGISWAPVSDIRFRAQFQRAVRAPNIGELFSPQTNGFPNIADPCSGGTNGGFDGFDAATQAIVRANCIADGVLAANVGTPFQINSQIEGLFGGNPDLFEESSDTYTIGAVVTPSALPGLSLTVDYYNIKIVDAIGGVPSQNIFDECYINGNQAFCDLIPRSGGAAGLFTSTTQNVAEVTATGIDATLDYNFEVGNYGSIAIHILGNYTIESSGLATPDSELVDCTGFYAGACGEPTPEYSVNTTVDWFYNDLNLRVRWQWIAGVDDLTTTFDDVTGEILNRSIPGVSAKNYVTLTGSYTVSESINVFAGIRNLTGTNFVIVGDASAEQSNTYPATYETLGRQFFFGASVNF